MKSSAADFTAVLAIPAMAGLGGASIVFSEFDDARGGILVGLLMIAAAVLLSVWAAQRRT